MMLGATGKFESSARRRSDTRTSVAITLHVVFLEERAGWSNKRTPVFMAAVWNFAGGTVNAHQFQNATAQSADPGAPWVPKQPPRCARSRMAWARARASVVLVAALVTAAALSYGPPVLSKSARAASYPQSESVYRPAAASAANSTGASPVRLSSASSGVASGSVPPVADEVPSLRTRTSRTYLVNGEYQAVLYSGSVNYRDATGAWQPIDNSLVASTVAGYALQNKANQYTLLLPSTLSSAPIAFQSPGGNLKLQLAGLPVPQPRSLEQPSLMPMRLPGVSVSLTAGNDAVKEALTLSGPQSADSLVYSLALGPGLQASTTPAGGIAITGPESEGAIQLQPPEHARCRRR